MNSAELKRIAAEKAVEFVEDGMVLGLGTGSTAALAVDAIGRRVQAGLQVVAIPTSEATAAQASRLGIPLVDFADHETIDLTIDGADAVDRATLDLVKGLGGALLREKLVAAISKRMIVIVDESKLAGAFGTRCPVPVEVVRFGWPTTSRRLAKLGCTPVLRRNVAGEPVVTDGGNYVLDCAFGAITDGAGLAMRIKQQIGVIESGLFIGLATDIIVAASGGIEIIRRSGQAG
ncbi:MAG: ribose-5-phosphate isomerase RpiA [Aliidongia sp.]